MALNLKQNERAERKRLITVAEWVDSNGTITATQTGETESETKYSREILGRRTEDSSIELNPDITTSTDILGITYSDVNKTEPQQDFDPYYIMGGSLLGEYLTRAMLANRINDYNGTFNVYLITEFIKGEETEYYAVKHKGCSIIPTAMGGDSFVNMPIEVHFSNDLTEGKVDKLTNDFTFTAGEITKVMLKANMGTSIPKPTMADSVKVTKGE